MSLPSDPHPLAVRLFGAHRLGHALPPGNEWDRCAVHESGHVIVGVLGGGTFSHVTTRISVSRMEDAVHGIRSPTPDASIAMFLGGPVAELLTFGELETHGASADLAAALRIALGDEGRAHVAAARARDILERHRGELEDLAGVLLRRGGLSFEEARRIMGAA
jgi:ATP-dependent Zn protease